MRIKDVSFSVAGQILRGKLFYPDNIKEKNPAVLLIHGLESNQEKMFWIAEGLAKKGYICLSFDLRGHGISDGEIALLSRNDHIQDVKKAYDFLKGQQNIDEENISVVGSSYGSYLAVFITAKRKVKNLVLRVPAMYPEEGLETPTIKIDDKKKEFVRNQKLSISDNTVLRILHTFSGNILIFESENDEIIPHQTIENYVNSVKNKSQLTYIAMKHIGHSLGTDEKRQEFARMVVDWFAKL